MSHIHHLGGSSPAAGQYQDYLGSLRAARLARRGQLTEAAGETLSFDSPIDPDQEPDRQAREQDAEEESAEPQDDASPPEPSRESSTGLNEHA